MSKSSFKNLSSFIGSRQLGLGWLEGISVLETKHAVTTDWHTHETTEMLFSIKGETHYEFRHHPPVTLSAGFYLVIPANVEHRVSNAIDEPGKRIGLNLRRKNTGKRRFAVFEKRDYSIFRDKLESAGLSSHPCTPGMKSVISELERLLRFPRLSSAEYGYMRILCCSILYAAILPPPTKSAPRTKIVDEAVRWLETHYSEKVSIDRLAAYMGYSRARLFVLFREHTGLSPNDYLQRFRVKKAKELLASGNDNSLGIASACGFPDSRYFSRVFKQHTGNTPLGYRQKIRSSSKSEMPFPLHVPHPHSPWRDSSKRSSPAMRSSATDGPNGEVAASYPSSLNVSENGK